MTPTWRRYQSALQRDNRKRRRLRGAGRFLSILVLSVMAGCVTYWGFTKVEQTEFKSALLELAYLRTGGDKAQVPDTDSRSSPFAFQKKELPAFIAPGDLFNRVQPDFSVQHEGRQLQVHTTLDPDLQAYLVDKIAPRHSRYVGMVVMDADNGAVLAMAGFDRTGEVENVCVTRQFPAASIFKIVTAAAALDTQGLEPDSVLYFNGGKYTLYRRQLKDQKKFVFPEDYPVRFFRPVGQPGFRQVGDAPTGQAPVGAIC